MADKRLGVVGERDVVMAFQALGMRAIPAQTADEINQAVFRLSRDGAPVVFLTERAARVAPEALERYERDPQTAVIPIPGAQGTDGFGQARVHRFVEKAIGADILQNDTEKEGG